VDVAIVDVGSEVDAVEEALLTEDDTALEEVVSVLVMAEKPPLLVGTCEPVVIEGSEVTADSGPLAVDDVDVIGLDPEQ
jgi:hypothetical protein